MKVLKFGGTSVGSIKNIKSVKEIITDGDKKLLCFQRCLGLPMPWWPFMSK